MEVQIFIDAFREAFGTAVELPIAFGYSDTPVSTNQEKINGCFFKSFNSLRQGNSVSLNLDAIGCMGGKFYTGFAEMNERVPQFVSLKEKYKRTPEMVIEFVDRLGVPRAKTNYLNLSPIDQLSSFENIEGLIFFATPDILSGLTTWTYFDNNSDDAVTAKFGSGCSAIITETVVENRKGGNRTFLGLFDPSARPYFEPNELSFTIPMSRFKEMYHTMRQSCLFDTHAWAKIRQRINGN